MMTSIPIDEEAYRRADWTPEKTWTVCVYGKHRPDLLSAVSREFKRYGIAFDWKPGPARYDASDPAHLLLRVTPDCPTHLVLRLPTGFAATCILAGCQAGFSYSRLDRLDAVILVDWGTPRVIVHEFYHAAGCDHAVHGEGQCIERLLWLRDRLPAARSVLPDRK